MQRHLLDRPQPDDSSARAAAFARIERAERPHPVTRALQRKERGERPAMLAQALRIAKGRSA